MPSCAVIVAPWLLRHYGVSTLCDTITPPCHRVVPSCDGIMSSRDLIVPPPILHPGAMPARDAPPPPSPPRHPRARCGLVRGVIAFALAQSITSPAVDLQVPPIARKLLAWPRRCQLAHAFLWGCGEKRLKFAQRLGQFGIFLTHGGGGGGFAI